jgi:hypothetical protein
MEIFSELKDFDDWIPVLRRIQIGTFYIKKVNHKDGDITDMGVYVTKTIDDLDFCKNSMIEHFGDIQFDLETIIMLCYEFECEFYNERDIVEPNDNYNEINVFNLLPNN